MFSKPTQTHVHRYIILILVNVLHGVIRLYVFNNDIDKYVMYGLGLCAAEGFNGTNSRSCLLHPRIVDKESSYYGECQVKIQKT